MEYADLPVLQLSSANIDRNGIYLLDAGNTMYIYVGSAINPQLCNDLLGYPNFAAVREGGCVSIVIVVSCNVYLLV